MSELPLDDVPAAADAAHEAARGQVVYLVGHDGERLAGIVPAEFAALLEQMTPGQAEALFAELEDAADVRAARARRDEGEPVIPWDQAKAEADL
ncbi:MAG: hypothetical protein JO016_03190 [Actinobacteria bacterium]|nr:hypothetical protein [Actinomycetota bacterium]